MKIMEGFWNGLSIKTKLLFYFFVILTVVSLFSLYISSNNFQIIDQFNLTMTNHYEISRLLVLNQENKQVVEGYINNFDEADKKVYQRNIKKIRQIIQALDEKNTSIESQFAVNSIRNSVEAYDEKWRLSMEQREKDVETYYRTFYEGERIESYTEKYIEELLYIRLKDGDALYKQLAYEAEITRQISVGVIVLFFFVAFGMGVFLVNDLIKPLKKLAKASIRMASGDLNIEPIYIGTEDEVGVLADAFNIMSQNIHELVSDLKQKVIIEKKLHEEELHLLQMEKLLKDAKFQALQSQINPHFLFNTLNTISRTAMFEDAEDTLKLTEALAHLFRYKLRNDQARIAIQEELDMIDEYIYLQQVRFKERLKYTCYIEPGCEKIQVPIFILQPLVENGIIHGIEPKIQGGKIRVKVFRQYRQNKTYVVMRVSDTGVGIEENQLKMLLKFESTSGQSIGVYNVYQRFVQVFQHHCTFKIRSKKNVGTFVELKFEWIE